MSVLPETGNHADFKAAVLDHFPAIKAGDKWQVYIDGKHFTSIRICEVGTDTLSYVFEYQDETNDPDPVTAPIAGLRTLLVKGTAVRVT